MMRAIPCAVLALALVAGVALAAETKTAAVVVKFENAELTVKVSDKEKTIKLDRKSHVHDANGGEVKPADFGKVFVKDAKLELVEEDGKLVEINMKK